MFLKHCINILFESMVFLENSYFTFLIANWKDTKLADNNAH